MAAVPNVRVAQTRQKMEINRIVGHLKVFFIAVLCNYFDSPEKRASLRCNLTSCGGNCVEMVHKQI